MTQPTTEQRIEPRLDDAERARLDALARHRPDSVRTRAIQAEVVASESALTRRLQRLATRVANGDLAPERSTELAMAGFVTAIGGAYRLGFEVAGVAGEPLTTAHLDAIGLAAERQARYWRRFMGQIADTEYAEEGRRSRVRLYGGSVPLGFWSGWVAMLPSGSQIEWRLGIAEHCSGCLDLAADSPYTPETLPTVPQGGDTACLANCKCHLVSTAPYRSSLRNDFAIEVIGIGAILLDPTSLAALAHAETYRELVEQYVYYRRLAYLTGSGEYRRIAESLLASIEALAASLGHTIRLAVTDREILAEASAALVAGYRVVDPSGITSGRITDDDLLLAIAIGLSLESTDRGKISAVDRTTPAVVLENGRRLELNGRGRTILFLED